MGLRGAEVLAPPCDAIIIVDVLSFSTAVAVAASRGAKVFPYRWKDDSRFGFAASKGAELAGPRGKGAFSLSPLSLMALEAGDRIVLPSPNGSTISLATGDTPTFAGCIRNAHAVARAASGCGSRIGVVPCGERWASDDSLRPAFEDFVGAGAIIASLVGHRSPEAESACSVFEAVRDRLPETLNACSSGQELIARGYEGDVEAAAALDADTVSPRLSDGAYTASENLN